MKKFLLFIFLLFLFVSPFSIVKAQTPSVAPTSGIMVQYDLPYPGLLPDSPLYGLKVFRDKLVSLLISDPLKKTEFDLLQADKRLSGAIALSQKGSSENQLVVSTISKGENYFNDALKSARDARKQGLEVNALVDRLKNASAKHEQEVQKLMDSSANLKALLQGEFNRINDFEKQAATLLSK
ncbi:MAG: DUF5667 domain-containing protein [Candidatus Levyibacteriota bacterium]